MLEAGLHAFLIIQKERHNRSTQWARYEKDTSVGKDQPKLRERSADKLVAHFERQIWDGSLPAGATLPPEREIVLEYGVSRTVAREAVLSLSSKGLVDARPGFRPVVIKPSYDTALHLLGNLVPQLLQQKGSVRHLFDLRIMMEASLVRTAAQEATRDDVTNLKSALAANQDAIEDSEAFFHTDVAFHGVLYHIPDNLLLPAVHRAYSEWLHPQWSQMPRMATRNQANYEAHARIYEAILMRDPDQAEHELRAHLASAWKQVGATFTDLA